MNKLTNRQRVFVELYLTLWNATEAAKQAGYSNRTANEQAARLLANVSVKQAVAQRIATLHATTDELLARLTDHARGDMGDCVNAYGAPDIDLMRKNGKTHLIKKIKSRTTTISKSEGEDVEIHEVELELYDAQAAIDKLLRVAGAYKDRLTVEHTWRDMLSQAGADPDAVLNDVVENVTTKLLSAPDAALQEAEIDDAPPNSDH